MFLQVLSKNCLHHIQQYPITLKLDCSFIYDGGEVRGLPVSRITPHFYNLRVEGRGYRPVSRFKSDPQLKTRDCYERTRTRTRGCRGGCGAFSPQGFFFLIFLAERFSAERLGIVYCIEAVPLPFIPYDIMKKIVTEL